MAKMPQYGQRSDPNAAPPCPRHPDVQSIDYCKVCNRPMCSQCRVPVEVRAMCVDCAKKRGRRGRRQMRWTQKPTVTMVLIGLCAVTFVAMKLIPQVYSSLAFMPVIGWLEPWRILTTAFLHANVLHILFNLVALWFVGSSIEPVLGWWRFLILYIASAIGGSAGVLAWCFVSRQTLLVTTVGASGAVFGLFAAIFVLQKMSGINTTSILILLAINLGYGFIVPNISWQAHVGGMIVGALVTWGFAHIMRRPPRRRSGEVVVNRQAEATRKTRISALAGAGMLIAVCAVVAVEYAALLALNY